MAVPPTPQAGPDGERSPGSLASAAARFPVGACVLSYMKSGEPVAVSVSSLTAISENPARVIIVLTGAEAIGTSAQAEFSINVLSSHHAQLYRSLPADQEQRLDESVGWRLTTRGVPVLNHVTAWMEAVRERVVELTPECVVLVATVRAHGDSSLAPLVVVDGGHGVLETSSLQAQGHDVTEALALVDLVRDEMEAVASDLECRVVAQALVDDQHVFLASAGHLYNYSGPAMRVGDRTAAIPPSGAIFVAWSGEEDVEHWLSILDRSPDPEGARADGRARLRGVRTRGFTVALHQDTHDRLWELTTQGAIPARREDVDDEQFQLLTTLAADPVDFGPSDVQRVEWLALPVFGPDGNVVLALGIEGLEAPTDWAEFEGRLARLEEASSRATQALGGRLPLIATSEA
ncbi:flavin reductase [Nocardia sp. R7R-8]|uniref:flavin reductase n=1 Tax=Nocardia sp. R7R-8 TaxID=3459304 RepID=UPI00403E0F0A